MTFETACSVTEMDIIYSWMDISRFGDLWICTYMEDHDISIILKSNTSLVALDGAPITNPISLVNAPVVPRRSARVYQSVLVKLVSVVVGQSNGQVASNWKLVGIHVHATQRI